MYCLGCPFMWQNVDFLMTRKSQDLPDCCKALRNLRSTLRDSHHLIGSISNWSWPGIFAVWNIASVWIVHAIRYGCGVCLCPCLGSGNGMLCSYPARAEHSPNRNSACTEGFWRIVFSRGWSAPAHLCCYLRWFRTPRFTTLMHKCCCFFCVAVLYDAF